MKKRVPTFLAGALTALLLTALYTTALAASGKLSYNFASISLNGEKKITAGEDLVVGEGKHIPGSVLYIDETGGKTNYLPVRIIAELLGAEVDYDAATKTVLLSTGANQAGQADQTAQTAQTAPAAQSAGLWKAVTEDGALGYVCEAERKDAAALPAYRLTQLPEDWKLEECRGIGGGKSTSWYFEAGDGGRVRFQCSYPGKARFADGAFENLEAVVKNKRQAAVQGYGADLYTEKTQYGTRALLAWENSEGILFHLSGTDVSEDSLIQAAQSIKAVSDSGSDAAWEMRWLPEGSTPFERAVLGDTVQETQLAQGTCVILLASPVPLAVPEEGPGASVKVNGGAARFWTAREPVVPKEMETETVGDITITSGVVGGYGAADLNALLWSDPVTGTNFRLLSGLDRETMLRIAASIK